MNYQRNRFHNSRAAAKAKADDRLAAMLGSLLTGGRAQGIPWSGPAPRAVRYTVIGQYRRRDGALVVRGRWVNTRHNRCVWPRQTAAAVRAAKQKTRRS